MTSPHERLDRAMDGRRLDLGLSWQDVAAAAKVSVATLRAIRSGTNRPSPLTKRRVEEALRWEPGSVDAIYADRQPVPAGSEPAPPSRTERLEEIQRQLEDLTEQVRELRGDNDDGHRSAI